MKIRPWLQGAGLAMLYLLPPLGQFLSPDRRVFYHQLLPATTLTRGMLLDLLALGLLGGCGFLLLDRATPRRRQILWLPVFCILAWIATRDISSATDNATASSRLMQVAHYMPGAVLVVAVALLLWKPRIYSYCVRIAAVIFAAGGVAALLVILPRLVIESLGRVPHEQAAFSHPVSNPWRPGQLRVVWILFDELSYRQAFEHRQPGIDLPAFTRFADESITFSQLSPVGYETERIVPSLLSGQPITDVKGDAEGQMLLQRSADAPWQHFDQNSTVFAAAKRQGWGTGVAGWYNPYCRILNTVLDRCYWTFGQPVAGALFSRLSSRQSSWRNALEGLPLAARFQRPWDHSSTNQALRDDYRNLLHAAKALIQDPDIRLAFIHMPVPHPPGLFKNPAVSGSDALDYMGNLLLADQAMAQLLDTVNKSRAAADTVLIVSSDHSWRIPRWRGFPGWTGAEERASNGGVFDQRPVLMVRFPQDAGAEQSKTQPAAARQIDRHESEMIEHALLLDLISGKVRTPEDWMATLPPGAPAAGPEELGQKK